uniref:Uncharacterized protein n=1 Tax=Panagrolaimus davidi TaxID=227884 RepID=A0A914Q6Z5_9BILA
MDSNVSTTDISPAEVSFIPEISADETTLIEKSADICFPPVSIEGLIEQISNENKPNEDLYTLDTEGNEYIASAEKVLPQPTSSSDNRMLKGDPKIAAKYQWRQGNQFCDGNEEDSSSESDDEDFNKILQTKYVETDEGEERKPKEHKKVMNNALDKEYYELPNFETLSITCLESCVIEPFGKVFQHYDALAMIKAHPNKPFLDIDTMLFTAEKIPIGRIYELIGVKL